MMPRQNRVLAKDRRLDAVAVVVVAPVADPARQGSADSVSTWTSSHIRHNKTREELERERERESL